MSSPASIAEAFVSARRQARALPDFPGELPDGLAGAYVVQDHAIGLWREEVVGWKVAAIHPDLRAGLGAPRLSGPVFQSGLVKVAPGRQADVPVVRRGFIAVETEIGIVLGEDVSPREKPWEMADLPPLIQSMRIAMEIAGSPLASINDIGPLAVVSDFGNNTAVAVGAEVTGWRDGVIGTLKTGMRIDGIVIGEGAATGPNGGPLDAFLFLINHLANRGRGFRKGDVISAGATTGIHKIAIGQVAEAFCEGSSPLTIRITEKQPVPI